MEKPRLIAFDMAGTTVDEHDIVYSTLREITRGAGGTYSDEQFAAWTGREKREAVAGLLETGDDARIDEVHGRFIDELHRRYAAQPPRALPGVEAALARLREAGVRVALTTGYDRPTTDLLLDALGWSDADVDAVVCATEVAAGRPAPDMILAMMERLGVTDPADVWAVGDTAADLGAAEAAGVTGIGVLTGAGTRQLLEQCPHRWVLESAAEVADLALSE